MSEPKPNEHGVFTDHTCLILYNRDRVNVVARFVKLKGRFHLGLQLDTPTASVSSPVTADGPSYASFVEMELESIRRALELFERRMSENGISAGERRALGKAIENLKTQPEVIAAIEVKAKEKIMTTEVSLPKKSAPAKSHAKGKKPKEPPPAPASATPPKVSAPTLLEAELIPLNMIDVDENYRTKSGLSDASIAELAASLGEHGQRQPIEVEPNGKGRYNLVFGHRRLRAAEHLGWTTIAAIVLAEALTPQQRDAVRLVENEQHAATSPVEQCLAVGRLLDNRAEVVHVKGAKWTDLYKELRDEIIGHVAAMVGKSPTWVRDRAYIARLSPMVQSLVQDGQLPLEHARLISAVASHEDQNEIAEAVKVGANGDEQPAPLNEVKQLCGRRLFRLAQVPWKLDEAFAGAPACVNCPANSATMPGLFEHGGAASDDPKSAASTYGPEGFALEPKAGVCTNQSCFRAKYKACGTAIARVSANAITDRERAPKAKKDAAARQTIREQTPTFIKTTAVEQRMEERLERAKQKAGQPAKVEWSDADKKRLKDAEDRKQAERQWKDAMRARVKTIEPKLAKALAKTPGAWSIYMLFRATKLFGETRGSKAAKFVESPGMAALLKLLSTPNWAALLEIEKQCGRQFALLDEWKDAENGMADKIAAALGVEVDAPPTVEDFLPKPEPETAKGKKPAEAKASDGGRKLIPGSASDEEDDE